MILIRKRTFFYMAAALLLSGCGSSSAKKQEQAVKNAAAAATANSLSKAEANRCRRIAEDFYDSSLKNTGFNGAMLVAKKGQIVFEQYNGMAHLKQKDTITATTQFHI